MMDSFELNKVIGALLAVVFVVFSVSIVSDSIFSTHAPEQPGYAIEVVEEEAGAGDGPAETGPSVVDLLQTADAAAGEAAFRACAACHTVDEGGANRVGPNLWDIVERPVAMHEGFNYSAGMREFSEGGAVTWDYDHLSEFLKAPRSYVQGTSMAYAGMRNPEQEADLIAYLRTLSNDPKPLPEPAAATEDDAAADGEAAPAGEEAAPADEEAPAETAPTGEEAAPTEEEAAPAEDAAPADEAPAEEVPAEDAASDDATEEAPADETPAEDEIIEE